jgi:hypothetical protein
MDIPYEPIHGMCVSADGKRLYLIEQASIIVVDTDSLSPITELPYLGYVAVSPNNQLVAISNHIDQCLYILRTSDYSPVFTDTAFLRNLQFSIDSRRCFGTDVFGSDSGAFAYEVDLSEEPPAVRRRPLPGGGIVKLIPSIDETKWFIYRLVGLYVWSFEVYDVERDSVIFAQYLAPGAGFIEITPNGQYAFYGNPGTIMVGPPPPSTFTIFDIEDNDIYQEVSTRFFIDSVTPWYFPVGQMAVTPDGRWLIALGANAPQQLLLYDIAHKRFVDYAYPGLDKFFIGLTVQNAR